MGSTRGQVKARIQQNLIELNQHWYSDDDLNQSIQDAYDDIAILTQCIQKKAAALPFLANLTYYNFVSLGVSDYLGTIAIFNNVSNLWLRDDLNLKDFDRIRRDWEVWQGTPLFWAPSDPNNIAICPKYVNQTNSYDLYYWTIAPTLVDDTSTFLIAADKENALVKYCTADLLEQAQEFNKAAPFWKSYFVDIDDYADRVKRNCKSDLLLRI